MEVIDPRPAEERNWTMFCHLAALAGYIFPFGNIIGPLIVWSIKKDQFPLVDLHGKAALNFQISITLYIIASAILVILLVGFLLMAVLGLMNLILIIVAAVKANHGEFYEYPLSIRFIR